MGMYRWIFVYMKNEWTEVRKREIHGGREDFNKYRGGGGTRCVDGGVEMQVGGTGGRPWSSGIPTNVRLSSVVETQFTLSCM